MIFLAAEYSRKIHVSPFGRMTNAHFTSIVSIRVFEILMFPFEKLAQTLKFLVLRVDLLQLWDRFTFAAVHIFHCVLCFLGILRASKIHHRGGILVTGSSSILASDLCISLAENGYIVFAAVRNPTGNIFINQDGHSLKACLSRANRANLYPIVLDVTCPEKISLAVVQVNHILAQAEPNSRKLVGIVNATCKSLITPVESVTKEQLVEIFDVNTIGPIQVICAFLPLLRHSSGRIVNISSAAAVATPLGGPFAASKLALEAATDALRLEVASWGISVSLVIPGSIDARIYHQKSPIQQLPADQSSLYRPMLLGVGKIIKDSKGVLMSPKYTTRAIEHALFSKFPSARYHVGLDAKVTCWIRALIPDKLVDGLCLLWLESFTTDPEKRVKFE